jgi:hypothetical protein
MWNRGLVRYLFVSVGRYAFEDLKIGGKGDLEQHSETGSMPVRLRVLRLGSWAELGSEAGREGWIQKMLMRFDGLILYVKGSISRHNGNSRSLEMHISSFKVLRKKDTVFQVSLSREFCAPWQYENRDWREEGTDIVKTPLRTAAGRLSRSPARHELLNA